MTELVQTPTPDEERPRFGITLAIAVACFALGVAAVSALPATPKPAAKLARADRVTTHATAPRTTSTPTATTAASATAATDSAAPAPVIAATDPTPTVTPAASPPAAPPPTPIAETPSPSAPHADSNLTMIQGRVAYLRCDGLRNERGRFPCPRDAALEQAVWDVLATLPRCTPSLGRGGVDVRLDLVRGERTQARVLAITGSPEPSLDSDQVYACVGSRLARLSTALDPIYMMVSFRAALR
jgi:hypothetical protein